MAALGFTTCKPYRKHPTLHPKKSISDEVCCDQGARVPDCLSQCSAKSHDDLFSDGCRLRHWNLICIERLGWNLMFFISAWPHHCGNILIGIFHWSIGFGISIVQVIGNISTVGMTALEFCFCLTIGIMENCCAQGFQTRLDWKHVVTHYSLRFTKKIKT